MGKRKQTASEHLEKVIRLHKAGGDNCSKQANYHRGEIGDLLKRENGSDRQDIQFIYEEAVRLTKGIEERELKLNANDKTL